MKLGACVFLGLLLPSLIMAEDAQSAMKRAADFYHGKVARNGGYVYYTSLDFKRWLGEGVAKDSEIWVQPPGTPSVGMAYLEAYQATKDQFYLDAAMETANALIYGQLDSGAWINSIDFDSDGPRIAKYRNGKGKGRNFSTLDDGISQAAIQFLARLDGEMRFQNKDIHRAVEVALDALLKAQYQNGAFPQGWDETPEKGGDPRKRANYPKYDWRTEGRIKQYWDMYTLNDDLAMTVTETLLTVLEVYQDQRYAEALKRFGDFLILAQLPAPQAGWAQQYNYEMQPIWARKFEPPAVSGRETEGVVATLMQIAVQFREKKYLEPIPSALAYLEESELPRSTLARYYELESNKPLYMERDGKGYRLTHDDSNLPSHYGWKNPSQLKPLQAAWKMVSATGKLPEEIFPPAEPLPSVEQVIAALDDEGRWVSKFNGERLVGQPKFQDRELYIDSAVFCRNMKILAQALME